MQDRTENGPKAKEQPEAETTTRGQGNGAAEPGSAGKEAEHEITGIEAESPQAGGDQDSQSVDLDPGELTEDWDGAPPTRAEFDGINDKYMRALAEVENIRRRAARDVREAAKFRASGLARDLLPVHDNLKRALDSLAKETAETAGGVIEGIELTLKEFQKALAKHGVEIVAPEKGEPFDSNLHEAMFQAPASDVAAGRILQVMAEGFRIHERLLRPAQVAVSSGPPVGQTEAQVEADE